MNNTQDLSQFGYRELGIAGELLTAYSDNPILGGSIRLKFNARSGNVFLVDEDYRVAMLNDNKLEEFYSCPSCGREGFAEEFDEIEEDEKRLLVCNCDAGEGDDVIAYL